MNEKCLGNRPHRRPHDRKRLSSFIVESIDPAPDLVVVIEHRRPKDLDHGTMSIAVLGARKGIHELAVETGEKRKPYLLIELARTPPSKHVLGCEAREVNLHARGCIRRLARDAAAKR